MSSDTNSDLPIDLSLNFTDKFKVNHMLSLLLGLRSMESYCKSLPFSDCLAACVDYVVEERGFNINQIKNMANFIPQSGPLLITSNHPTGILDGAVLLCALLSRREDILIVANDLLGDLPVLGNYIIPIKKTASGDQKGTSTLIRVRRAWKQNACVVVFPAGTVEHWHWNKLKVCDAPWTNTFQNLAEILKVPEIQAHLTMRNPVWFHIFAAISKQARLALLLHAFHTFKNNNVLSPVSFNFAR